MKYVIGFFLFTVAALTVGTGIFTVDERQFAIVFAMGEMKHIIEEPGLYFKWPNPFQNVSFFDRRMTSVSSREPDRVVTADRVPLVLDHFVKWRIVDPKKFYVSFGTDEQAAESRISQLAQTQLTQACAKYPVRAILSSQADKFIAPVLQQMRAETANYGIEIADVRVKRIDYSDEQDQAIFERMKTERSRQASALRAEASTALAKVKAQADRERSQVLAQAQVQAQTTIGRANAEAAAIYAQTAKQDPEFFKFYQSMLSYRRSFADKKQMLVIDPNSKFFRYMKPREGVQ